MGAVSVEAVVSTHGAHLLRRATEGLHADGRGGFTPRRSPRGEFGLSPTGNGEPSTVNILLCGDVVGRAGRALAPRFFEKMGFKTVEHKDLPMKVWRDCVACPKYGNCSKTPSRLYACGLDWH